MAPIQGWSEENLSTSVYRANRLFNSSAIDTGPRDRTDQTGSISKDTIYATFFSPTRDLTVSQVTMVTGTTAANYGTATGLKVLMGLGTVAANGVDVTPVAITAHDATLFTSTSTQYARNFDNTLASSYTVRAGQTYAALVLITNSGGTITTLPSFRGITGTSVLTFSLTPPLCGQVSATNITSSPVTIGSGAAGPFARFS